MDVQPLNDCQLEWLKQHFKEGVGFSVMKDSRLGVHFCEIKNEVSYPFTCKFHCKHRRKCSEEQRKVNFATYKCTIYFGPRSEHK